MYNMHWMLSLCSSRTGHGKMVYFYRLTTNASYVNVIMCNYGTYTCCNQENGLCYVSIVFESVKIDPFSWREFRPVLGLFSRINELVL